MERIVWTDETGSTFEYRERIIRCKNCLNCVKTQDEKYLYCRKVGMETKADGFCDMGMEKGK